MEHPFYFDKDYYTEPEKPTSYALKMPNFIL